MVNLCAECGSILPPESEEGMVCIECQLLRNVKFMELVCPECGEKLEIYFRHIMDYYPAQEDRYECISVDLIYHCTHCGCDWNSVYSKQWGDETQTLPKRQFWG